MSEVGKNFFNRNQIGNGPYGLQFGVVPEDFVAMWSTESRALARELQAYNETAEQNESQSYSAEALANLVDSIDLEEYIGLAENLEDLVRESSRGVVFSVFSPILGDSFVSPSGRLIASIGDRRSLHRHICQNLDDYEEILSWHGKYAPLDPTDFADYIQTPVLAPRAPDAITYVELEKYFRDWALKSGIHVVDKDGYADSRKLLEIFEQAVKELPIEYLPSLARLGDRIAEAVTTKNDGGMDFYTPIFRAQGSMPYCEMSIDSGQPPKIYADIGGKHTVVHAIQDYIYDDSSTEEGTAGHELIQLFDLEEEIYSIYDEDLTVGQVFERRKLKKHPQLFDT